MGGECRKNEQVIKFVVENPEKEILVARLKL
jgi:hypothetical protein